jgi:hypothetical protein
MGKRFPSQTADFVTFMFVDAQGRKIMTFSDSPRFRGSFSLS